MKAPARADGGVDDPAGRGVHKLRTLHRDAECACNGLDVAVVRCKILACLAPGRQALGKTAFDQHGKLSIADRRRETTNGGSRSR
jgi:hypothetical protein